MRRAILVATFVAGATLRPQDPAAGPQAPERGVDRTAAARVVEPTGAVTLRDAVALVLAGNPELQASIDELRAAESRTLQAGLRPNPIAGFEVEDWGGTLGFATPELTLSIAQLVELGGKRRARAAVSGAEATVARLDGEATRLVLLSKTHQRFLEGLALQEISELARETVRIAEETIGIVRQKVQSGAVSPAEMTRAEVELSRARLDRAVLVEQLALARSRLSALWGTPVARFLSMSGRLDSLVAIPSRDSLLAWAPSSPDIERWEAELRAREAEIARARAEATPDLEIVAGYRARLESDDHTFVAGLVLPLPVFSRNQGTIAAAGAKSAATRSRLVDASLSRQQRIVEAHSALLQDRTRIETLQREVIPGAARAFSELQTGYQRGRFSYLDLLEARRTWTEAQHEEVMTFLDFHQMLAELERLLGGPLSANARGGRDR